MKNSTTSTFGKMKKEPVSVISFMFMWVVFIGLLNLNFSHEVLAQQVVTGTVIDAESEETLPGVNIRVKDTNRGTSTNVDGYFSITLEEGQSILVFSFIGFITQEIDVEGQNEILVELQPDIGELDELVVIGYGAIRKRDMTGSVGQIGSDEIGKITSTNAEQSLQGRVSGVQITSTSGAPGAGAAVRIRGVGTFNNSSPIYVVDGVILDDISFLNSSDIQSMEILKDASATAIYGSRGANGVILVQTKTGAGDTEGTVVRVSAEGSVQQLERKIDLLNGREFATISNEIRPGSYNNVNAVPNTDWQDQIFEIAPMQNHQISVSGSGESSDYYVSLGYSNQQGIIGKSNYERLNLKFNNTYRISEKFKMGNNITIAPYKQQVAPNVTFAVYRAQPVLEPYYDDGSFGVVRNVGNPLADLEYSNNYNSGVRIVGNIFAEAIVAEDFLLRTSFGTDAALNRSKNFTPAYTIYNPDGTASQQNNEYSDIFKGEGVNYSWLWENTANYIKEFDKHQVNAVVGLTMQQTRSERLQMAGQNVIRDGEDFWYVEPSYIVDEANNIDMLSSIFNGVDPGQYYNMISYLGRVVYTYNDKYLTTITMRRDGSSKFAEENRWGYFPSFALGWNVDRESFMEPVTAINNLKLRFSWGEIGNEKISYYDRFSRVNSGLLAVFGNPDAPYVAGTYGKSGNPDLTWETTTQMDAGIEITLLENRLSGEVDFYNRVTDDILVELSTPGHLGNGQGQRIRYNAASVLNRGVEFTLGWEDKVGDLGYGLSVLGNTIHNEVLAIGGNSGIDSLLIGGGLANGQTVTRSTVGNPIGAFYGYVTDGIFQNQEELDSYPSMSQAGVGDLRFRDINGDGQINGEDRTMIGSPIPDFVYGFSVDLNYKRWDFSVGFQGQYGNELFNGKNVVRPDPYNFEQHVWDRWTGEGTSNSEPQPSFGGYNYLPSDRFIHDGSYLRLRSLILGYSLPANLLNKLSLTQARFYVKATNLLTFTKYTGYTPEIGSGDVLSNGIDTGVYPIPRVISVGFNTTF
ncbi:MAG: TonB-dependent receptor [Gracilimonas sp.]